jgi:hypothetical protein
MPSQPLNIKEAIAKLEEIARKSKLGYNTILVWCGVGSGEEYEHISDIKLDQDDDGSLVLVCTDWAKGESE